MLLLVVGSLVLVLLIGTALLMTMRTETTRTATEKADADVDALLESAVTHVLDLLRQDLWGDDDVLLNDNPSNNLLRPGEVLDEAFDGFSTLGTVPGPSGPVWEGDAWLASTVPYRNPDTNLPHWQRMSWAPIDEKAALQSFFALYRASGTTDIPRAIPAASLVHDPIIPLTAAVNNSTLQTLKFFYLDADGDGIRDSVRLVNQFAGAGGDRFDLAIRIIDHGSMLNLNTATDRQSWLNDTRLGTGRHLTELLLNPVVGLADPALPGFANRRARAIGLTGTSLPFLYDLFYAHSGLLSGLPLALYLPSENEAALRNRFQLVPYRSANGLVTPGRVDSDFAFSMVNAVGAQFARYDETQGTVQSPPAWLSRLDPNRPEFAVRTLLTTLSRDRSRIRLPRTIATGRRFLPSGMRLPMLFTNPAAPLDTNSSDARVNRFNTAFVDPAALNPLMNPERVGGTVLHPETGRTIRPDDRFDLVEVNANPIGRASVRNPTTGVRVGIDVDADGDAGDVGDDLAAYAGELAGAMWLALTGDPDVGRTTDDLAMFQSESLDDLKRAQLAWQFAANLIDYRDDDLVPTVIGRTGDAGVTVGVAAWPLSDRIYGFEPQPFITEVYAHQVETPDATSATPLPNTSPNVYAVELYYPYPLPSLPSGFPLNGFTLRIGGAGTDRDLSLSGTMEPQKQRVWYRIPQTATPNTEFSSLNKGFAEFTEETRLVLPENAVVELVRTMPDGRDIVVDRIEAPADSTATFAETGTTQAIERQWSPGALSADNNDVVARIRFRSLHWELLPAIATQDDKRLDFAKFLGDRFFRAGTNSSPALQRNAASAPPTVQQMQTEETALVFWHKGLAAPWAFSSLLDLSKVWLIGANLFEDPLDTSRRLTIGDFVPLAQDAIATRMQSVQGPTFKGQTSPSLYDRDAALSMAGRVDFVYGEAVQNMFSINPNQRSIWSHRLFDLATVRSATHDGVDNDGDWVDNGDGVPQIGEVGIDEPTESLDAGRIVAGRLNINTAPERVLQAALALYSQPANFGDEARIRRSTVIAAFRDGQPVFSQSGKVTPRTPLVRPYRSVADLTQIDLAWSELAALDNMPTNGSPEHGFRFAGLMRDLRRDGVLSRAINLLTADSDVYTAYIALVDNRGTLGDPDDDLYVRRAQITIDRTNCYRSPRETPRIVTRQDAGYYDVTR